MENGNVFCFLTRTLMMEFRSGDVGKMEEAAEKFHGERLEKVKRIAEMCVLGPVAQELLIDKFGDDMARIIVLFTFGGFQ